MSEKQGLRLARLLQETPALRDEVRHHLSQGGAQTASAEQAAIEAALKGRVARPALPPVAGKPAPVVAPVDVPVVARFDASRRQINVTGADEALFQDLKAWLKTRDSS